MSALPDRHRHSDQKTGLLRAEQSELPAQAHTGWSLNWESPQFWEKPKHVRTWLWNESLCPGSRELAQVSVTGSTTRQQLSVLCLNEWAVKNNQSNWPPTADWPVQMPLVLLMTITKSKVMSARNMSCSQNTKYVIGNVSSNIEWVGKQVRGNHVVYKLLCSILICDDPYLINTQYPIACYFTGGFLCDSACIHVGLRLVMRCDSEADNIVPGSRHCPVRIDDRVRRGRTESI